MLSIPTTNTCSIKSVQYLGCTRGLEVPPHILQQSVSHVFIVPSTVFFACRHNPSCRAAMGISSLKDHRPVAELKILNRNEFVIIYGACKE